MRFQVEFIQGLMLGFEYIPDLDLYDTGDLHDLFRINLFVFSIYIQLN